MIVKSAVGRGAVRTFLFSIFLYVFFLLQKDLWDLFEDCGDIYDVFIASQSKEMCFTYG